MKVGVLLAPPPEDLGEWLADAAALDAAGADALWIDPGGEDPAALAAALAALTFRSLLVIGWPAGQERALATVERLSRGRLALVGESAPAKLPQHRAAAPPRPPLPDLTVFHALDDGGFEGPGEEPERWERTGPPEGRAGWRAAVAEATGRGVAGLLVPAGPQLLDLLRNPEGRGDRRDLQLAQG